MKSSGFDMEETHLQDIDRIKKLTLMVMLAFVWCYKIWIFVHENIQTIKIKKHGRRAKSIFKHGLSFVAGIFLNAGNNVDIDIFKFLSCT